MFLLELFAVIGKLFFELIAACLGGGDEAIIIVEVRDHGFGDADIVAAENIGHVAGAETIDAHHFQCMTAGQQRGLERFALDNFHAALP